LNGSSLLKASGAVTGGSGGDWYLANRVAPDSALDTIDRTTAETLSELVQGALRQ
jgi:hypothetical protein